jgi:hypothetical protein
MDPEEQAVSFAEFLALARDEGLVSLDVTVVQAADPASGRGALVTAVARSSHNAFSAVGEATAVTAPPEWHPFLTTLAELRAKARALRELTGLEHAVLEELSVPYLAPQEPTVSHERPVARPAMVTAMPTAVRPTPNQAAPSRPPSAGATPQDARAESESRKVEEPEDQDDGEDLYEPPRPSVARSTQVSESAQMEEPDDDAEPAGGGLDSTMEAKLLRLAMTIAEREGENLSEAEARQKLDDFFIRAFKHPLSRATQQEGQRVVHRLASDLARLRPRSTDE